MAARARWYRATPGARGTLGRLTQIGRVIRGIVTSEAANATGSVVGYFAGPCSKTASGYLAVPARSHRAGPPVERRSGLRIRRQIHRTAVLGAANVSASRTDRPAQPRRDRQAQLRPAGQRRDAQPGRHRALPLHGHHQGHSKCEEDGDADRGHHGPADVQRNQRWHRRETDGYRCHIPGRGSWLPDGHDAGWAPPAGAVPAALRKQHLGAANRQRRRARYLKRSSQDHVVPAAGSAGPTGQATGVSIAW